MAAREIRCPLFPAICVYRHHWQLRGDDHEHNPRVGTNRFNGADPDFFVDRRMGEHDGVRYG